MSPSPNVNVAIDLAKVRENARAIKAKVGVTVWGVIKADGYGLGASRVADALKDVVDGFCVFRLSEATDIDLKQFGKPILALGPPQSMNVDDFIAAKVQPAVSTVEQATALRNGKPSLCVDVGMQRFACPSERLDEVIRAGDIRDAFAHGTRLEHAIRLKELLDNRGIKLMAAATDLLDEPRAWLEGVRPGVALYRGSVRASTHLVEARDSRGPAGYGGFVVPRFGIILAGYSNGLARVGICLVNGKRRKILEVGMQSAFVEIAPNDKPGDEVVLLGDMLKEDDLAAVWKTSQHEVLMRMSSAGVRKYE